MHCWFCKRLLSDITDPVNSAPVDLEAEEFYMTGDQVVTICAVCASEPNAYASAKKHAVSLWTPDPVSLARDLREEHPGVKLHVDRSSAGHVVISTIVVPDDQREKGTGTTIMKTLIQWADVWGVALSATPDDHFGGNKARLTRWYRSLGFVPNTGGKADFTISESMRRDPA